MPGAYHIASNNAGSGEDVAFKNPDGSKVVVAHNNGASSSTFQVLWDGIDGFTYTLPAGATVTFTWKGSLTTSPPSGGYSINPGGNGGKRWRPFFSSFNTYPLLTPPNALSGEMC